MKDTDGFGGRRKSEGWGLQRCQLTACRECSLRAEQRPERARRRRKVSRALATALLAAKVLSFPTEHGALNAHSEERVVWLLILKCCSLNLPHFLIQGLYLEWFLPVLYPTNYPLQSRNNENSSENYPRLSPELWGALFELWPHCTAIISTLGPTSLWAPKDVGLITLIRISMLRACLYAYDICMTLDYFLFENWYTVTCCSLLLYLQLNYLPWKNEKRGC